MNLLRCGVLIIVEGRMKGKESNVSINENEILTNFGGFLAFPFQRQISLESTSTIR